MQVLVNDFVETIRMLKKADDINFLDDRMTLQLATELLKIKAIKGVDESIQNMIKP